MPSGGWFIDKRELEGFNTALKETADSLRDMRPAYKQVAQEVIPSVRIRVPRYGGANSMARKPTRRSAYHARVGTLFDSITSGSSAQNAWVKSEWEGPLVLQEFGGKSIWKGGGRLQTGRQKKRSRLVSFERTSWGETKQHLVYTKPRRARGYFIWNAWWFMADRVGEVLGSYIGTVANRHGISVEIGHRGGLSGDLQAEPFKKAA